MNIDLKIPEHIAIIMDGNGRWAKERGLPRTDGHIEGQKALEATLKAAAEFGIKYLTVYAFSTENWNRPQEEVDTLMSLLVQAMASKTAELIEQGV
ncbi:MAG: di-trans,poly-cis-decaprenylcistransferase, partial [Porphyromonas sp.]